MYHDEGSWSEDEKQHPKHDRVLMSYDGTIQIYHFNTVADEQLRCDQRDDQIMYVLPMYEDLSERSSQGVHWTHAEEDNMSSLPSTSSR
eukprot:2131553-Amphidinium_carterae.3